jgi:hypothetical protein
MIGQIGGHGGRFMRERRMNAAKIVHDPKQENSVGNGLLVPCQGVCPTDKRSEISTERAIQALNERRIDTAIALAEAA